MSSNPRPRVLCVDDDEDSRVMLSMLLGIELIEAKTVGTAAQALSSIEKERFDLYLLDARLPDLNGFELCRRLRAIDRHTPILFFSGAAFEADRKRGIAAGANAYLIKPDLDGLLESIKQLVSRAEGTATAKIIPFKREINSYSPFTFDPVAA
jgi:two-component system phosphate regulon response regulator PhoB